MDFSSSPCDAEVALGRLSHRYAAAVDAREPEAFEALFLPEAGLTVARSGEETDRFEGRAAMAGVLDQVAGFDRTRHAVLAHSFEIDGRRARGEVAMEAHHVRWHEDGSGTDAVLHGSYSDRYGLDESGSWKFAARHLEVDWSEMREVSQPRSRASTAASPAPAEDRQAIADLILRYCRAVDRLDPEGIRACYHPEGRDRHTGFDGERDEYVEWVMGMLGRFDGTMHLIGNHQSEVDGDTARAETYGLAFHWGAPAADPRLNFVSAFRYVDCLRRRQRQWRILERVAIREWTRELDAHAWMAPEGEAPRGSRDGSDQVYAVGFRRFSITI